jgi:hypothetical protein
MASTNQIEFFGKLLSEKQFPADQDKNVLKAEFEKLGTKSASAWIEKALQLPDVGADAEEAVPPPF